MTGRAASRSPLVFLRRAAPIVAIVAGATAIAALALVAARWQWGRHEARAAAIEARDAGLVLPEIPAGMLLEPGEAALPPLAEWRRVVAEGTFEPESLTILRNRSVGGVRANEYLAWLDLDSGGSLLVLVGWEPLDGGGPVALPPNDYRVEAILRSQEEDDGRGSESATRITAAQMPAPLETPLPGYAYALDVSYSGSDRPEEVGLALPEPPLSLGPHLAYTIQWCALAVLAPIGAALLMRRRADDAEPARRGVRRGSSDEEIEDALLDAAS